MRKNLARRLNKVMRNTGMDLLKVNLTLCLGRPWRSRVVFEEGDFFKDAHEVMPKLAVRFNLKAPWKSRISIEHPGAQASLG